MNNYFYKKGCIYFAIKQKKNIFAQLLRNGVIIECMHP